MAHSLTETSTFTSAVQVPDSGDARTAASVETPFQALTNRAKWLYDAVQGTLQWDGHLYTATPSTGIGVFVGVIRKLVVGAYSFSTSAATEAPGSLPLAAVSTWHYLYGRESSGVFAVVVSTDPPTADLMWSSTGVGTLRYLGTFRTDGSGYPIAFEAVGGAYLWRTALAARQPTAGNATSPTNVDCSPYAPPHARLLRLTMNAIDTSGASKTASLSKDGDGVVAVQLQIPANTRVSMETEVPCSTAQVVDYQVSSADATLTLNVMGWRERA